MDEELRLARIDCLPGRHEGLSAPSAAGGDDRSVSDGDPWEGVRRVRVGTLRLYRWRRDVHENLRRVGYAQVEPTIRGRRCRGTATLNREFGAEDAAEGRGRAVPVLVGSGEAQHATAAAVVAVGGHHIRGHRVRRYSWVAARAHDNEEGRVARRCHARTVPRRLRIREAAELVRVLSVEVGARRSSPCDEIHMRRRTLGT